MTREERGRRDRTWSLFPLKFTRVDRTPRYLLPPAAASASTTSGRRPGFAASSGHRLHRDKAGKPVGIHQAIGRRPTIAFGNSDGDFEMLEWTTSATGPRLGVIVHHTDAEREWAYDRDSHVGELARGLDEAAKRGWVIVDMKADWRAIYPALR